jgi:TPR repeat protein
VERDAAKAVELYSRATDAGDMDAMQNLSKCFKRGNGVGKDLAKAAELRRRAADAREDGRVAQGEAPRRRLWSHGGLLQVMRLQSKRR